ncbi:MAG: helix-turn-helix transcriptional regulator [Deltaproteobacteria bacterium]|nr:helix-turn-helix transcriptional regulator [Deltaproteobacteria bacterium]
MMGSYFFSLEPLVENFAQNLKELRTQRGLSQVRLAELLGVTARVYNRWEREETTPRFDTVVSIANVLEVSLDELAGRVPNSGQVRINNPELHRLYAEINNLSDEDQHALEILLDSLVKRSQIGRLLHT